MARSEYKRTCSECPNPLERPNQKTCSAKCRAARSRRLKRISRDNGKQVELTAAQTQVAMAVRNEAPDVAHDVIQDELRPIVREAITEDVLRAIETMVGLAPQAVAALAQDLHSEDSKVRQKAYDLWLRYTVGHNAIVRPEEDEAGKQLVVNFNLPRPEGGPGTEAQEDTDTEAQELRVCNMCGEEKDVALFVAASDRCSDCHDRLQEKARELLAPES